MKKTVKLKKEITFIYADSAQESMYRPIADEALNRGYNVLFSKNPYEKCEIGVYCEHINFPQYSKASVIMLHDLTQGFLNWPNIWYWEPWDKYDIGILPSKVWVANWLASSGKKYANTKSGVYEVGWPKADKVYNIQNNTYREEFNAKYGLDSSKRTVLYAPAWENDGKQDDFVRAMQQLDVNILIKQANWDENKFPQQVKNIRAMKELHEKLPNVVILDPKLNIFEAIAISDVLVSEESSTMCEAVMMGIPAVSVSNWLIPDTNPSRYPSCNYNFVEMTKKELLTECVSNILKNYEKYNEAALEYSKNNFSNMGNCARMIIDIIDDYVEGRPIRYDRLVGNHAEHMKVCEYVKHYCIRIKREISTNYATNSKVIGMAYKSIKRIWYAISGKKQPIS